MGLNLLAVAVLLWMVTIQNVKAKAAYLGAHEETHARLRVILERLERIEILLLEARKERAEKAGK